MAAQLKESKQYKAKIRDLEKEVEAKSTENAALLYQKEKSDRDNSDWKGGYKNLTQICLKHKAKLLEISNAKRKREDDSVLYAS